MNLLNKRLGKIAFILVLIFSISTTYGQLNKTAGTRITDVTTEKVLKENAILDLESTSKGFFLPRMTTLQRDAIKKDMGKDNGLAIYNIDNDCVEYWSERANKWMSLCGSLPPAKLDLDSNSCQDIEFIGFESQMVGKIPLLKQGDALVPDKHWMKVRVKVNQVGTYTMAVNSNNGYFFSGEGQFQSIGTYDIVLKGMGIPIKGYDQNDAVKGDKLVFSLNGINSNICTDAMVYVEPADLDFSISKATYTAKGKYNVGKTSSKGNGNTISLNIDVVSGGLATITAKNDVLGMKFTNTKNITVLDKVFVLEPVLGENIPFENDANSYEFTFEVNTKDPNETIKGSKASLTVEKTQIKAIFADVNLGKEPYYQGSELNDKHTIELPVKVINSGKTNLYLDGSNVRFVAENVMLTMPSNADETQLVKFTAVKGGVLPKQDTVDLVLSGGEGKRFEVIDDKILSLPIENKPVAYIIDCSSIKTNRSAMPYDKEIGTSYYIIAEVDVTVEGEYEINTSSPVDGISFSTSKNGVKEKFIGTGRKTVELYATDKTAIPKNKGEYSTNLLANDLSAASCPNIKLKVGYSDINVLIIRDLVTGNNAPVEAEALFFTGKNGDGKSRFGEEGVYVETGDMNVTTWTMSKDKWVTESAAYANEIKGNKYNFILITNVNTWMSIDNNLGQSLIDYVKKDGVLVYTLPGIVGLSGNADYFTILSTLDASTSLTGKKYDGGVNLLKFLVGAQRLPANYYGIIDRSFTSNVVDQGHPLSKPKYGANYVIKSGAIYQDVFWYALSDNHKSAFNITGTNLVSLVADRGAMHKDDRGLVFTHKTYPNVVVAPIISPWFASLLNVSSHVSSKGEPYANGYDNNGQYEKTQTGLFSANVYIGLMERVANK